LGLKNKQQIISECGNKTPKKKPIIIHLLTLSRAIYQVQKVKCRMNDHGSYLNKQFPKALHYYTFFDERRLWMID
jgi:hypothetical protein